MRRLLTLSLLVALAACAGLSTVPAQRYAVFFSESSAALDDNVNATIAQAAVWANEHPVTVVNVIGYADPNGSPQANIDLSRTRAQVVADALTSGGVASQRIRISAEGATPFVLDSQEARRVTISLDAP